MSQGHVGKTARISQSSAEELISWYPESRNLQCPPKIRNIMRLGSFEYLLKSNRNDFQSMFEVFQSEEFHKNYQRN